MIGLCTAKAVSFDMLFSRIAWGLGEKIEYFVDEMMHPGVRVCGVHS